MSSFLLWLSSLTVAFTLFVSPAQAAHSNSAPLFREVVSLQSALAFVTAATGSSALEKDMTDFLKAQKVDLQSPFPSLQYDGNKIRVESLTEPILIGSEADEFFYKGIVFQYNLHKTVKQNFADFKKAWGEFHELGFPENTAAAHGADKRQVAELPPGPFYATLFTFAGVTTVLKKDLEALSYFGFKWYKNNTAPLKIECQAGKMLQTKGKDHLVIETSKDNKEKFYTEVDGKKQFEGDVEKITFRGKDSWLITNGNYLFNELPIGEAMELNRKLVMTKNLCANPVDLEKFNQDSRRVQDALTSGKIKTR